MKFKIALIIVGITSLSGCTGVLSPTPDRADITDACYATDSVMLLDKGTVLTYSESGMLHIEPLDFLKEQEIVSYKHFRVNTKAYFDYEQQSYFLSIGSDENARWMKDTELRKIKKYRELSEDLDIREGQLKEWICRP